MSNTHDPINVGEFRQRATELIRAVADDGINVIIARRGQPVAELRPLPPTDDDLAGSVEVHEGVDLTDPVVDPSEWAVE